MGKEIPWEIRERAEELYIVEGLTFEQVAGQTGVSVSQLKRWARPNEIEAASWQDRRREYRTAFDHIKRDTVLLRKRLVAKALKSLDPQHVYAIASLESTVARIESKDSAPAEHINPDKIQAIKTPADAVDALGDVVERKINAMLVKPGGMSLAAIKEVKQALELIEKCESNTSPAKRTGIKPKGCPLRRPKRFARRFWASAKKANGKRRPQPENTDGVFALPAALGGR